MLRSISRPGEWLMRVGGARYWPKWEKAQSDLYELASLGSDQVEYLAADLVPSASELRKAASDGPEIRLLRHRMAMLQIDADELGRSQPATWLELKRTCAKCPSRGDCIWDIASELSDVGQEWEDFCPNAATLNMLSTLESYSHIRG